MLSNTPITPTDAMNLAMLWRSQDKSAWQIKELLIERGLSQLETQLTINKVEALISQDYETSES